MTDCVHSTGIRARRVALAATGSSLLLPTAAAWAQASGAPPALDTGDTAWVLVSSALVLMMTLPGLALFYGGLVRAKNILNVLVQCFCCAAVIGVVWILAGYSLAFGPGGDYVGGLSKAFPPGAPMGSGT